MDVTVQEAAVFVTAAAAFTGFLTYIGVRAREQRKDSRQEGADKAALNGVVKDVTRILEVEMPRLQHIEVLTEKNAIQIANLAELENKRSTSLDRILDHLEKKGP